MPAKKKYKGGGGRGNRGGRAGRGRGRGAAQGQNNQQGVNIDCTQSPYGNSLQSPFAGMGMMAGMGMGGMGGMPGFMPGMMPGMMMSPMGNGGFGKPVTVKMSAHDALLFQNQQARQAYEQQHAYMQWFSKQQQQQQQIPQAAPTTEEDEWGDEEEQDAGLALLAQREEAEQQQKLQAIHNEKQQFIRDNVTVFMDKYPDADTAFAELEAAAEQHAAMPTPEKSKKLTNDLVERTAKAAAEQAAQAATAAALASFSPASTGVNDEGKVMSRRKAKATADPPPAGIEVPAASDEEEEEKEDEEDEDLVSLAASAASPMMATAWKPSPRVEIKPFSMPPASRRPIGAIAASPDKPRTRASSKVKVKSLSLVNPMPVLKAKLQQVVANKVTTKATAVDAKFKRKAQSLCDSVAVLVKARDAVEFESLLEDFDIYKKISMPRKLESRLMQVIWVIARGKVTISLEDFSATPKKKK